MTDAPRRPAPPALRAEVRTQDEVEIATLRGKVAFFEEENRRLAARLKAEVEAAGHAAAASARSDAEKIRALLKQREEEARRLQKELDEKETWYSPAELERERKRMEAAIEADRRRESETLQRQIRELEHRVSIRSAESETVARQLREKDDLIRMLSEREDEIQAELKARDGRFLALQEELKALKDAANVAAGKEKELNDKLKQKNTQLAQLGKERGELVQELARARTILAQVGGAEEAAAAVEEQERATRNVQDQLVRLEADLARARDEASALSGRLTAEEGEKKDLRRQIEELEAQMTDATDARMKVEGQLSELLRKSGDRDQFEKQLAMLKADRDARAAEARAAGDGLAASEAQLAKIRQTWDGLVRERDELLAKVSGLESEGRLAAAGSQVSADWEARCRSATAQLEELEQQLARTKVELGQAKDAAAKGAAGGDQVGAGQLRLASSRAELHASLVQQMLEGVNNSVSLLRRNSELLRGYVEDCGLLANAIRRVDYTRLEPAQQQMLVELIDQTQPDVIVKNMKGISEENAESIGKAKKLILDYSEAFRRQDGEGVEIESSLARAQGLLHATDPDADVAVKIESVMPAVSGTSEEAVLFAWALLREAREQGAGGGQPAGISVGTDGLTVTFTLAPVDKRLKDRYRDPPDAQSRLVRGFAVERNQGRIEFRDDGGDQAMLVTLKASI